MKPTRIMITGAGGFTGQHACQHFSNAGYQVIPIVRTKKGSDFESKFAVIECDLTSKNDVMDLMSCLQPDYVLHLAGQNAVDQSWKEPLETFESNVMSTLFLLEAIRKSGRASKVVIVGSALEINLQKTNLPPHPYSISKTIQTLCAGSWVHLFNMDIILAKPTNLIGPGFSGGICAIIASQVAAMIKGDREKRIEVNNLSARRDFLDVRDAVRAYQILFEKGISGKEYNIATGVTHSVEDVICCFQKIAGIDIMLHSKINIPDSTDVMVDLSEMKKLGWKPYKPFLVTLQDVLAFHMQK